MGNVSPTYLDPYLIISPHHQPMGWVGSISCPSHGVGLPWDNVLHTVVLCPMSPNNGHPHVSPPRATDGATNATDVTSARAPPPASLQPSTRQQPQQLRSHKGETTAQDRSEEPPKREADAATYQERGREALRGTVDPHTRRREPRTAACQSPQASQPL